MTAPRPYLAKEAPDAEAFDAYPDGELDDSRDLEREALERDADAREQDADDEADAQYDD